MTAASEKLILILSLLCLCFGPAVAQDQPKNSIYLEAGGNGLFGSVNYERQLTATPGLMLRVGAGFYGENKLYLTVPVGVNYLFRLNSERSFIDAGFGATWARANGRLFSQDTPASNDNFVSYVPSLGYRRHTAGQYMWRVSVAPVINQYGFVPWLGASFGKRF